MTLVMVFSFAACQHEEMPALQEESALRTVSVNLSMPQGKPVFGEGASRAATDEGAWNLGDELLMILAAGEQNSEQNSMVMMLTLKCNAQGTWDVLTDKSYISFDNYQTFEPYSQKPMLQQATGLSLNQGTWTVKVNEEWGENIGMGVAFYYAPEMEFNANGFNLKADASTTAPEYWTAMNVNVVPAGSSVSLQWNQAYSRLRVYTGMAGDEVKLTSSKFDSVFGTEPTDGVYTATTDAQGNAYFYGATVDAQGNPSALTSDLKVELTKVQGIILTTPITLLEATNLVSVTLAAGQSYKLIAEDKREAFMADVIEIDGSETSPNVVKTTIASAYDEGKYIVLVTGKEVSKVLTSAIYLIATERGMSLSLLMPEVEAVPKSAFGSFAFLKSVSFPAATEIGESAFRDCTSLTNASFPKATSIGGLVFCECKKLATLSFGSVISSVGLDAFWNVGSEVEGGCALTLASGQQHMEGATPETPGTPNGIGVTETDKSWSGHTWKSITLQ